MIARPSGHGRRSSGSRPSHGLDDDAGRSARRLRPAAAGLAPRQRDRAHRPCRRGRHADRRLARAAGRAAAARARERRLAGPGRRRRHARHPAGRRAAGRADSRCWRPSPSKCAFLEAGGGGEPGCRARAAWCARAARRTRPRAHPAARPTAWCWRAPSPSCSVLVELAAPLLADGRRAAGQQDARRPLAERGDAGGAARRSAAASPPEPSSPLPRSPLDDAVCAVFRKIGADAGAGLPRREGMAAKRPLAPESGGRAARAGRRRHLC